MRITKCDICKGTIDKTEGEINISVGGIFSGYFDICESCAKPITEFLKSKGLIEKMKSKKRRRTVMKSA